MLSIDESKIREGNYYEPTYFIPIFAHSMRELYVIKKITKHVLENKKI